MVPTRLAQVCTVALIAASVVGVSRSTRAQISVSHEGSADLTGDDRPEHVRITAVGPRWDSLRVRLEIWDADRQQILYADEWSSRDWCGGPEYSLRDGTTEEWVREELEWHADPEYFRPGGSKAPGFSVGNVDGTRGDIRWDLVDQLWRRKYGKAVYEHAWRQPDRRQILEEFRPQVSQEEVDRLIAEFGGRPDFIYHPHWDALRGIAWSERLGRFVFMLLIG